MAPCGTRCRERPRPEQSRHCPDQQATLDGVRGAISSLLLVVDIADDVGDVLVALLLLFDEGGIVERLSSISMLVGALDRVASPFLPCASASASSSETNSASGGLRQRPPLPRPAAAGARRPRRRPARARVTRRERSTTVCAFRTDDRVLVEVVEFRAAIAAETLGAELGFCHGPVP